MQQAICIWAPPKGEELVDFIEWGITYGDSSESIDYNPAVLERLQQAGIWG